MDLDDQPSGISLSRGQLIAIFSGLAVLGLLIGFGAAELTAPSDDSALIGATPVSPAPSTGSPTDSPTVSPTGTSGPSADPTLSETASTPSASAPTFTGTPDYQPIPEDAAAEPGLDFGLLTRVVSKDGVVTLRFDRAAFYTGEEAKQHNGGTAPDNDYLIENTNPAQRSFNLDPRASIIAASRLRSESGVAGRQTLTVAEFIQNSTQVLTESTTDLPVWLRHTDGLAGPVTALAEQYLP
jgi:hypothetical protein